MSESVSGGNIQSDGVAATFSCIPSDPLSQNVLASALADSICRGKSRAEIANILQFLQILSCLMKNYLI